MLDTYQLLIVRFYFNFSLLFSLLILHFGGTRGLKFISVGFDVNRHYYCIFRYINNFLSLKASWIDLHACIGGSALLTPLLEDHRGYPPPLCPASSPCLQPPGTLCPQEAQLLGSPPGPPGLVASFRSGAEGQRPGSGGHRREQDPACHQHVWEKSSGREPGSQPSCSRGHWQGNQG